MKKKYQFFEFQGHSKIDHIMSQNSDFFLTGFQYASSGFRKDIKGLTEFQTLLVTKKKLQPETQKWMT